MLQTHACGCGVLIGYCRSLITFSLSFCLSFSISFIVSLSFLSVFFSLSRTGWYSVRLGQIAFARGLGSRAPLLHPENSLARPSHCIATCDSWTTDVSSVVKEQVSCVLRVMCAVLSYAVLCCSQMCAVYQYLFYHCKWLAILLLYDGCICPSYTMVEIHINA